MPECPKRIEAMEKDILHLKGQERLEAKREYIKLLRSNRKICGLDEPIYLKKNRFIITKSIQKKHNGGVLD